MLQKRNLQPGMKVRNIVSSRTGEVRAEPGAPDRLCHAADHCLAVTLRVASGNNEGKLVYRWWQLANLELYEEGE